MTRSRLAFMPGILLLAATTCLAAKPPLTKFPKQAKVQEIVQAQFKQQRRQPGELISQGDVKPIFEQLAEAGWKVSDQAEILKLVPSDGDPLVKQLRSASAKKALKGLGNKPGVYDRLDRMLKLPEGGKFLRDVLSWPDPSQMLKTLTTTDKGADLAGSLSNAPRSKDFTKPTGRIYTPEAFTARLLKSYVAVKK